MNAEPGSGVLMLAATPLGRAEDASARLVAQLGAAELVAAEDTRRLRNLASALGVELGGRVVSYYDAVETERAPMLLDAMRSGRHVLLVTDAGMPSVSDPGYRLVAACAAEGIGVTCLPGPSAVTTALAVSGLPSDRFCFEGFPPRKQGERRRWFGRLAAEGVRGEVTVVLGGAEIVESDPRELVGRVEQRAAGGVRLKDAVAEVAELTGVRKKELYDAVLAARD